MFFNFFFLFLAKSRVRTVLKSPWIFFNFECSGLKRFFLMLFGCLRQNINHRSENWKVIYIKCSMCYAIIKHQFKTCKLKNVEKLVKQTVQAFKSYENRLGMWIFVISCKIILLVGGPWKVLKKSLKNGCNFLYEPWKGVSLWNSFTVLILFAYACPSLSWSGHWSWV